LDREIPFNRPHVVGEEFDHIGTAIRNSHLSGNGPFSQRCCEWLERELGTARALLTHSCTAALELSALLIDVGGGDEVILPSFTFPSTANAFVLRGATPVFVDIRPDTLNIDEELVADAVTERTRAIVPVHYAGVACAMDAIEEIASSRSLAVVEDAAQAVGSSFRGRPLGTLGDLGALSFHETKNVICGEGGALLLNDPLLIERAEVLHEKGTNRSAFFRGQVDKYTWIDVGSSFLASDLSAAFLFAQLERADEIKAARLRIWDAYHAAFAELEQEDRLRRPVVPEDAVHNAHMYYVLFRDGAERDAVMRHLADDGIASVFHYVPLHSAPAGRRFGRAHGSLEVTDSVSERLLRLPLWVGMQAEHVERVAGAVARAIAPSMRPSASS
jgi:dTDP-4-amino-4,6-dideoxygalactose transaminase